MAEKDAKPKKQSTIKQIIQIYKYTAKEDKALPWLCLLYTSDAADD